ncbi:unnamed protein product [Penicillium camemberti]|uniref:Str. FM013 n=1 Tax=Penicillium camemberti (strain FM 013) TaxID=1429867 RepID=A0A0G4PPR4_PENC3|nr:unnamed protein product [Penicillium camemberti]
MLRYSVPMAGVALQFKMGSNIKRVEAMYILVRPHRLPLDSLSIAAHIALKWTRNVGRPRADGTRAIRTEHLVRFIGRGATNDQWIPASEPGYSSCFEEYEQRSGGN